MYFNILQAFLSIISVTKNLLKNRVGYDPSVSAKRTENCPALGGVFF